MLSKWPYKESDTKRSTLLLRGNYQFWSCAEKWAEKQMILKHGKNIKR